MKKGYKIFTSILIVGLLIVTGGSAMADWTTNAGQTTVLIGANSAQLLSVFTVANPVYTVGAAEALALGDTITFTLTNGVVFSSNKPVVVPSVGAASLLSGGLAGNTTATFRVTTPIPAASTLTFSTGAVANLNVSAVVAGANADFLLSLNNSAGGVIVANKSLFASTAAGGVYPFVGRNLVTVTNTATSNVADVLAESGPYTKFEGNLTAGNQSVLNPAWGAGGVNLPAAQLSAKKLLITLSGDFTGIAKITCNGAYTGSDSAGVTTGGLAGQFLINADKTAAYAVNNAAFVGFNVDPKFFIDGTTPQAARAFTAKVENLVDGANYVANTWLAAGQNYSITRNGFFFAANSLGPLNTIKISDKSGKVPTGGAKVFISAWDVNGTKLAEATGNADILLQNNQTITLTGPDMAARFVGTPMKYEVIVQSTNGIVTNVKTTTTGVNTTVFSIVTGGI